MVVEASSVEDSCPKEYSRLCDYAPGVVERSRPNQIGSAFAETMMNKPLSTLDLIVLVAYLGGITIVGMRVSRRVKGERFKQLKCLELRGLFREHYRCH